MRRVHKVEPGNQAESAERTRAAVAKAAQAPVELAALKVLAGKRAAQVRMQVAQAAAVKAASEQMANQMVNPGVPKQAAAHLAAVEPRSLRLVFLRRALVDRLRWAYRIQAPACRAVADRPVPTAVHQAMLVRLHPFRRAKAAVSRQTKAFSLARAAVHRDRTAAPRDPVADKQARTARWADRKVAQPDRKAVSQAAWPVAVKLADRLEGKLTVRVRMQAEECKAAPKPTRAPQPAVDRLGAAEQQALTVPARLAEQMALAVRRQRVAM